MAKFKFCILLLLSAVVSSSSSPHWFAGRPRRFLGRFSRRAGLGAQQVYRYETRYFSQRLDHFSFTDLPRFPQRYLISTEHWVGPAKLGPIFLYCGNEGDIEWFAANTGFIWEIAPRFGAMVLFPEHRYYGESMPYGSREEAYKNASTLSYLTTEQAIADFAVLIRELKRNFSAEACPVVLFGGSYGGMLAAWMRLKYPHMAVGALASSAPILQFEEITPPETFYNIVSNAFRRESSSCSNTIKKSWDVLNSEGQKDGGLQQLAKTFHMCGELKSAHDLANWLDSAYSYLAMVNYPYPSDFLMPLPGYPIREVCKRIDGSPDGSSILERIFNGVSVYYNYSGNSECFQLDDDPHGMDGWNWQACSEMVMPMSSDEETSMYPVFHYNYSSYMAECWEDYHVIPRPRWITSEFGGHTFSYIRSVQQGTFIFCMLLDHRHWHIVSGSDTVSLVKQVSHNCLHRKWGGRGVKSTHPKEISHSGLRQGILDKRLHVANRWITLQSLDIENALKAFGSNIIFSNGLLDPWSGGSVLRNISETIVALVMEEGAHHIDLRASTPGDPEWLIEQRRIEIRVIEGWINKYQSEKKASFDM